MLDRLYQRFDSLSRKHEVFKLETIGDSWMCATNLIKDQPDHVKRIVDFSLDALLASGGETVVYVDDPSKGTIQIRVGFHSGPVVGRASVRATLDIVSLETPSTLLLEWRATPHQVASTTPKHLQIFSGPKTQLPSTQVQTNSNFTMTTGTSIVLDSFALSETE